MEVLAGKDYPRFDSLDRANKKYDYAKIAQMLVGEIPLDQNYFSGLNFKVYSKIKEFDVYFISLEFVISARAKELFQEILGEDNEGIEYVQCMTNKMPSYFLKINRKIDCLDYKNSDIERSKHHPELVTKISKYVFERKNIQDIDIFRIPERKGLTFVTESVMKAVQGAGLVGFQFIDYKNPPDDYKWRIS